MAEDGRRRVFLVFRGEYQGQGARARLTSSPLEMAGEKIVPSVPRFFSRGQTLYVFFQAYYPERTGKSGRFYPDTLRAGLIFFRDGIQTNATPLLSAAHVDPKSRTASFRISPPLTKLPAGRYTAQVIVIAAGGTQYSAFGRAYMAVERPSATPPSTGADSNVTPRPPSS